MDVLIILKNFNYLCRIMFLLEIVIETEFFSRLLLQFHVVPESMNSCFSFDRWLVYCPGCEIVSPLSECDFVAIGSWLFRQHLLMTLKIGMLV